jgi:protein required for attachment to host cells
MPHQQTDQNGNGRPSGHKIRCNAPVRHEAVLTHCHRHSSHSNAHEDEENDQGGSEKEGDFLSLEEHDRGYHKSRHHERQVVDMRQMRWRAHLVRFVRCVHGVPDRSAK